MKKLFSVLVIISLILIITGCKKVQTTTQTTGKPYYQWTAQPGQWDATIGEYRPEAGATLKLWVDNATWAESLITEYNRLFPEVIVNYDIVGAVDTRAKMELDGPAGLGADVFVMPHDHIGAALRSHILGSAGEYEAKLKQRIISTSLQTVTANETGKDEIFAFPISGESLALFYNKKIISDKGEQVATTWEEIINQATKYTNVNQDFYWVAMDVGNAYDMIFIATAHGYQLFGPQHNDPNLVNFNSPEMINALTWHHNFRQTALNVDAAAITGNNIKDLFETGKLAYIVDGPWDIQRYKDAKIDFGVMKIPTINNVQPYSFSGNQVAAVSTYSKYPAAARTLANFMANIPGAQVMYNVTGKLPTLINTDQITGLATDPYLSGISDQLVYSIPMPTITEMSYFWKHAGTMFSNAWNGSLTPTEAANKAQADYNADRELAQ